VLPSPITRQLYRVERHRSGSSLEGTLVCLEGAKSIYLGEGGLGLREAVKAVNPGLASRVTKQFEAAESATRAIGIPLEQAVAERNAVLETAYQQTRALEILIKVDVVSALGVTLTFSSNDGD
jgi:predicted lipoprotein